MWPTQEFGVVVPLASLLNSEAHKSCKHMQAVFFGDGHMDHETTWVWMPDAAGHSICPKNFFPRITSHRPCIRPGRDAMKTQSGRKGHSSRLSQQKKATGAVAIHSSMGHVCVPQAGQGKIRRKRATRCCMILYAFLHSMMCCCVRMRAYDIVDIFRKSMRRDVQET